MDLLLEDLTTKKKVKIITANRPGKLELLVNEELEELYNHDINVLDVKYAISKDVGSAIIIYQDGFQKISKEKIIYKAAL